MAALSDNQRLAVYSFGETDRFIVVSVRNVTTDDTLDLAPWLVKVRFAAVVGMSALINGLCTVAGTVVTFSSAGLLNDGCYLIAVGSAAP